MTFITYNLSGGTNNSDPDLSLGGDISTSLITLEKLFDDITPDQSLEGITDYRCFYIKNNSTTSSLLECNLYVSYKAESDVSVYLGFDTKNERQTITITSSSSITGGYIAITYENANAETSTVNANWDSSSNVWADNIKNALNSIIGLEDVMVTATTPQVFQVDFLAQSGRRFHKELVVQDNLNYIGTLSINITKNISGSPINTTATIIGSETEAPTGITFSNYTPSLSYYLGNLLSNEKLPVWIKRVVPTGTTAFENDGLTLRLIGGVP